MKKVIVLASLICLALAGAIHLDLVARESADQESGDTSFEQRASPNQQRTPNARGISRAEEMVKVAREAYESNEAAYGVHDVAMEQVVFWSRQLVEAELRAATSKEDQVAVQRAYRDRMQRLNDKVATLFSAGFARGGEASELYHTVYYLAEAEYLLQVTAREEERVMALRTYRDRMKQLHVEVTALKNVGARGGEAEAYHGTKYWLLEAEYLLEQAQK